MRLPRGASRSRESEFAAWAGDGQHRLYRQAYLLTGEAESARDLVQATLLKVFIAWRRVDNPPAYAYRTLVNLFLRDRRQQERERRAHLLEDTPAAEPDPGLALTLLEALDELTPRMRSVVVLRYWEDLSVDDTARALGCSAGTVKSTSARALAHLRARLGPTFLATADH